MSGSGARPAPLTPTQPRRTIAAAESGMELLLHPYARPEADSRSIAISNALSIVDCMRRSA